MTILYINNIKVRNSTCILDPLQVLTRLSMIEQGNKSHHGAWMLLIVDKPPAHHGNSIFRTRQFRLDEFYSVISFMQVYLLTCDTCGCLTLDQGIRSHGVDTS